MTLFVGIDPSIINTGVVLLDENADIVSIFNSKDAKIPENCNDIQKYSLKAEKIADFISKYTENSQIAAGYEDYSFGSVHRGYSLAEYGGILKYILYKTFPDIHIMLLPPAKVKKFATGNGSADKKMVQQHALSECSALQCLPKRQCTSDVCDAYFMARMAHFAGTWTGIVSAKDTNYELARMRFELVRDIMEG